MRFKPHDYQEYAIRFILGHPLAAIILDMGLGKTSITLTAISLLCFDYFEVHKALVIAPLRVARNTWTDEVQKWDHLKGLRLSVAVGTEEERRAALLREADVYVINRENVQWLVENRCLPKGCDMLVVDELSSFKNGSSKRFRALMKIRPFFKRAVGLTGTPTGNGLMDLWAEFKLLDMGERLGKFITGFRTKYFVPDKTNGHIVYSYRPLPGAEDAIYERIKDMTLSMKAEDHLAMPRLISNVYPVEMEPPEKEAYERLKKDMVLSLGKDEITAASAGVLAGKLSQMANGAIYDDDGKVIEIHERKLDALEDNITAALGKPVLVAYWFQHDLIRIKRRLQERGIQFEELKSDESLRRWNEGKIPVALIHPASAGHGLNLQQGGNILIWFGLTWSLELYQQTNARLWRQGQPASFVVIQHILAKGTVDYQILRALQKKNVTQEALIAAVKANIGGNE